ncbi:PAC2 family [Propionibacterium australiense]|nr:PAC2 family [Propionibacterium australiense]VEH90535.1 PAC2 family [Propionibacterium australiense]
MPSVVIAAFEGWNDAADAATGVIRHLASTYPTELWHRLDSEEYYDFQATRPRVELIDDEPKISWPATEISLCHLPHRDALLISGPEPNMHWRSYCEGLISAIRSVEPELVVILGAMLTDSPHSRPLPVNASSSHGVLTRELGIAPSDYEGPIGIVGVLADACERVGLTCVTLWASVPHYVATPPSPKATLSLLTRVEDLVDEALDPGEIPELAQAWERGVNELASNDPDVAEYISDLEEQQDAEELPDTTGDTLAAEFQRYLRRRNL